MLKKFVFLALFGLFAQSVVANTLPDFTELVEKQGGKIWIESVVNAGTAFYFTLPKAK